MRLEPAAAGALGLFMLGAALALVAPMADQSSKLSEPMSKLALQGKHVYEAEGCVYCHTQQVRAVSNDIGLGTVETADPTKLGLIRIGPDLSCYGDRQQDARETISYLKDPRSLRPASTMPRLERLDEKEFVALSAYLAVLECNGVGK